MKDVLETMMSEGAYRTEYCVIVTDQELGEFMAELIKLPNIMYEFMVIYMGEGRYNITFSTFN